MKREVFLTNAHVDQFLDFFAERLTTWEVSYTSTFWRERLGNSPVDQGHTQLGTGRVSFKLCASFHADR